MFCDEDFCLESGSWGGFCDLVTKRSLLDCDCVLGVQLWVLEGLRSVHWVQSGICPRLGVFTHREVTRVTSGQKNFWCMDFMWVFWCCSGRSMLSSLYSVEKQSDIWCRNLWETSFQQWILFARQLICYPGRSLVGLFVGHFALGLYQLSLQTVCQPKRIPSEMGTLNASVHVCQRG